MRKERTSLFPPILRDEILGRASRRAGEHVLVYQTVGHATRAACRRCSGCRRSSVVYGLQARRGPSGNVTLKRFSEDGFIEDLASARAVIAGGGFSLMGEAVYLGKPMLAVPLKGQFEQTLNALYLREARLRRDRHELYEPAIAEFLERTPEYAKNVALHKQDRNRAILAKLDELIAEIQVKGRLVSRGAEPPDDPID